MNLYFWSNPPKLCFSWTTGQASQTSFDRHFKIIINFDKKNYKIILLNFVGKNWAKTGKRKSPKQLQL